MKQKPPCRIYGLLAREAPVAVLFRRGPTKYVQMIRWDTAQDIFVCGQWLHGQLYERRGDLSPDGSLLVYFAAKWGKDWRTSSWTAVSKPPYFTALTLWFKGDAWSGGGLFKNNNELGLNNGGCEFRRADEVSSIPIVTFDMDLGTGENSPIQAAREMLGGWKILQELEVIAPFRAPHAPFPLPELPPVEDEQKMKLWMEEFSKYSKKCRKWEADWEKENPRPAYVGYKTTSPGIIEKRCGSHTLRRTERLEEFKRQYVFSVADSSLDLSGAEWADWDQRGRLVFSREGKIFAVVFSKGSPKLRELADFNANTFTRMKAPEWATEW